MDNLTHLDRLIAEALKRPPAQRLKELEHLLESAKLTIPQIKLLHEELAALRKRLGPGKGASMR